MRAGLRINELSIDADPIGVALHRTFEDVTHTQILADLPGVEVLALEGEGGVSGDDETVVQARQFGGEIIGDAVGEIVLGRIVGEVGERQHDDGDSCRLGRRLAATAAGQFALRNHHAPPPISTSNAASATKSGVSAGRLFDTGGLVGIAEFARTGFVSAGMPNSKRIHPDRLGDVLELGLTEIAHGEVESALHLSIGVLGKTDRARLANALQPRGDIDAVAHQIAVAFLDDITEVNAYPKFDALVQRDSSVPLDHRVLHFECTTHRIDCCELDDAAVAGALDDAAMVDRDCGIDQSLRSARNRARVRSSSAPASGCSRPHPRLGSPRFSGSRSRRLLPSVAAVSDRTGGSSGRRAQNR